MVNVTIPQIENHWNVLKKKALSRKERIIKAIHLYTNITKMHPPHKRRDVGILYIGYIL